MSLDLTNILKKAAKTPLVWCTSWVLMPSTHGTLVPSGHFVWTPPKWTSLFARAGGRWPPSRTFLAPGAYSRYSSRWTCFDWARFSPEGAAQPLLTVPAPRSFWAWQNHYICGELCSVFSWKQGCLCGIQSRSPCTVLGLGGSGDCVPMC